MSTPTKVRQTKRNSVARGYHGPPRSPGAYEAIQPYLTAVGQHALIDAVEERRLAREIEDAQLARHAALVHLPALWQRLAVAQASERPAVVYGFEDPGDGFRVFSRDNAAMRERLQGVLAPLADAAKAFEAKRRRSFHAGARARLAALASRVCLNAEAADALYDTVASDIAHARRLLAEVACTLPRGRYLRRADLPDGNTQDPVFEALTAIELKQRIPVAQLLAIADQWGPATRRYVMARDKFATANLRLVVRLAQDYWNEALSAGDLIQEGNCGLLHAISRFDWRRGLKFSTYATGWIRQFISRAIRNKSETVRRPVYLQERIAQVQRAHDVLVEQGRDPTAELIAEQVDMSAEYVDSLLGMRHDMESLDQPVLLDSETTPHEFITDERTSIVEVLDQDIARTRVAKAMSGLSERERTIITLRFGITREEPMTLEACAQRLGFTRERARQIEAKALAKLRGDLGDLASLCE